MTRNVKALKAWMVVKAHGLDDEGRLNALNRERLLRLQQSGWALPSNATLGGRYALRCALTNHRTRMEDIEALVPRIGRPIRILTPARHVVFDT